MLDPGSTVLSQYQNSPTLAQWIRNLNTYHDVGNSAQLGTLDGSEVLGTPGGAILTGRLSFIEQFIQGVWDLNTASGYGLDVLGRIVGVSRVLRIATTEYFGFAQMPESQPFSQGPFYAGQAVLSQYTLDDNGFRTLVRAKALANICDGSIPGINAVLSSLFPGRGNCYVQDNGDMSITYVFAFVPTLVERAIIYQSGVLPRPTGCKLTVQLP
jgi:hypothetical protein